MTEYLSKTSYWQALESLPVKISSPYDHKEFIERTTLAKSIGDERLKLFQLKFDFTRSSFPLEPGCVINDETGEYIGMLICTPKDHHSIILARPPPPPPPPPNTLQRLFFHYSKDIWKKSFSTI
jgi:hypothetical protein